MNSPAKRAIIVGMDGASMEFGMTGQHSTFIMAGAGVSSVGKLQRQIRVVDVSPPGFYLIGGPMPKHVEGGVIYEALKDPEWPLTEQRR